MYLSLAIALSAEDPETKVIPPIMARYFRVVNIFYKFKGAIKFIPSQHEPDLNYIEAYQIGPVTVIQAEDRY